MRLLLVIALIAAGSAQAQTITGIDILDAGTVKLNASTTIHDSSISTGTRTEATGSIARGTTTIEAAANVVFGVKARLHGRPNGRNVTYRVVWRYPEPGLRNPATGTVKFSDELPNTQPLGSTKCCYYWTLGDDWTLVPGRWVIEFWDRDRMLASKAFTLVRRNPPEPPPAAAQDSNRLQKNDASPSKRGAD
jgi:hypothetical protein